MEILNSVLTIPRAKELEASAKALLDKASEIRRAHRSAIHLELHDNGLISMKAWKRGQPDSAYPPLTFERVVSELSLVVQELQQPEFPLSPDTHAR
jgi:hypothetical protein